MKKNRPFIITHVLIISGPPDYIKETKPYHFKVFEVDELPPGFTIKPTLGDAFLKYKDDGTVRTACMRNFFQKTKGGWRRWPFQDNLSPKEAIKVERKEVNYVANNWKNHSNGNNDLHSCCFSKKVHQKKRTQIKGDTMKVKTDFKTNQNIVTREVGEKAISKETEFYHKLKKELQKQGHDVIKKLVQKDGHMFGDSHTYYIRERKWKWCIVDSNWAIELAHKTFNKGEITLSIHQGEYW